MADTNSQNLTPNKQVKADTKFKPGVSGNPAGRPKRKTLTELIHAKLDDTPEAWNAVVGIVLEKILKEKDKDVLRALWQYTDGMPKQSLVHEGELDINEHVHIYKPKKNK